MQQRASKVCRGRECSKGLARCAEEENAARSWQGVTEFFVTLSLFQLDKSYTAFLTNTLSV